MPSLGDLGRKEEEGFWGEREDGSLPSGKLYLFRSTSLEERKK